MAVTHRTALGLALAAGSGLTYGSVNVAAKIFRLEPLVLAAGAYLVGGVALSPFLRGVRIPRGDWPKLLTMALIGGALAPVMLFYGLRQASAVDAGLLLTLELVGTAVLAFVFLHERASRAGFWGLGFMLVAAAVVAVASAGPEASVTTWTGIILVAGAAIGWAFDNAVSGSLVGSHKPHHLIALKGLIGGIATTIFLVVLRIPLPPAAALAPIATIGLVGICVSSLLYYNALQFIGAAKTSAVNVAVTALVAAAGGSLFLGEPFGWLHAIAIGIVLAGLGLMWERRPSKSSLPAPG